MYGNICERKFRFLKKTARIRFELVDALTTRLHIPSSMHLQSRNGVFLLAALFGGLPAWADESADQLERARLLREFQEAPSRASSSEAAKTPSLPATNIEIERLGATESLRTQRFQDSQWRKLIGDQQMQLHKPPTGKASESQWRAQIFERDRQAEDLSADILRRDLEYRSSGRR
jgi:hypothetical protein